MIKQIIGLFLIIIFFGSCRQNKEIIYLQGIDSLQNQAQTNHDVVKYKVQIADVLYVKVNSNNEEINEIFNAPSMGNKSTSRYDEVSMYFQGYNIDNDGYISLPVLGRIYVKDKTIKEIEDQVKVEALAHIKNVSVVVKLGLFKVALLGEIGSPGVYYFYQEKTSLFEAIAISGEITDYGNRKNILIVRPTETGSITMRVDLTDGNFINSD